MSLKETISKARTESNHADGKCSMCAVGDEPENGRHRGKYSCGNESTCMLCNNAGMEYGDQCAACGRIEKRKAAMGAGSPSPLCLPPVELPLKLCDSGSDAWVEDANGVEVISRTHGFKSDKAHEDWCRWVVCVANAQVEFSNGAKYERNK